MKDDQHSSGKEHSEIVEFYTESYEESERLGWDVGPLELIRTQEVISRYLPEPPAVVIDVGGAHGVYSCWLREQGYAVHLVDPVPRHVEQANEALSEIESDGDWSAHIGDARSLPLAYEFADLVLLMGPLYHLAEKEHRIVALKEALRVLKPGGVMCAATISKFASFIDGLKSGFLKDPAFVEIAQEDLVSGRHKNPTDNPFYWTNAYFQHPDDTKAEIKEAGFKLDGQFALEGVLWAMKDFESSWKDEGLRNTLLTMMRTVENEESLMGASPHIMTVARKTEKKEERDG